MEIKSHLNLIYRRISLILTITAFIILLGLFFGGRYFQSVYKTTAFATIAVHQDIFPSGYSSSYDNARAADSFTETVQGWFKDPSLLNSINNEITRGSGPAYNLDLSAERQEKQNLLITFSAPDAASSPEISSAIYNVLASKVALYNLGSETSYKIAVFDSFVAEVPPKSAFLILFLVFCGLAAGISLSYLYEYLSGKCMSFEQIENALGKTHDIKIQKRPLSKKYNLTWLKILFEKNKISKCEIIQAFPDGANLKTQFESELKKTKFSFTNHHTNPLALADLHHKNPAVLASAGKTRLKELENLHKIIGNDFMLIIVD